MPFRGLDAFSVAVFVFFLRTFGEDEEPLQGLSGSYCGDSTFATGVTVWASSNFVYGVRLECAAITDTCAPPSYPASLVEGGSPEKRRQLEACPSMYCRGRIDISSGS